MGEDNIAGYLTMFYFACTFMDQDKVKKNDFNTLSDLERACNCKLLINKGWLDHGQKENSFIVASM